MFEVNSPRVKRKSTSKGKRNSCQSINQLLQRTLSGTIDDITLLSWKETVKAAMRAGRTTAIVATLESGIHFSWKTETDTKEDPLEIVGWRFKKNMENALEWTSREGLSHTLVFDRENTKGMLPTFGCLALQWFPSGVDGYKKDSLMGFWRTKMIPKSVAIGHSRDRWRKIMVRGLVTTGQPSVTLSLLEENKDFYWKEFESVERTVSRLCCKDRCRDYLTKEKLSDDLLKNKIYYLDQSCEAMVKYVTKEEGLDWFLGFNVVYKRTYVRGESSINKMMEMYQSQTGKDIGDIKSIEDFVEQASQSKTENTVTVSLSGWAYFMVTKRGW